MGKRRKVFLALMICALTFFLFMPVTVFSTNGTTEVVSTESAVWSVDACLVVDSEGNVHVAWEDGTDYLGSGADRDIFYKKKVDGSWTTTEVVSTESTGDSYLPSLVVDSEGNVHVAWNDFTDYGGSGTDMDIFYKKKVDGD